MDDEHRGIRCDDLSRKGRCRDMDEIAADAQGTVPDERRGAGVWSTTDDEDPSVLTLVARGLRNWVEREFTGPDHCGDSRGEDAVGPANPSRVPGRPPLFHIMEPGPDRRPARAVRSAPPRG